MPPPYENLEGFIVEAPVETSIGDIPSLICDYGHIYQNISAESHAPGKKIRISAVITFATIFGL